MGHPSRSLLHWSLRAAVTAAVLAYISHDVDHADLRAALSAVHVRDLLLPLAVYLAGQVLSAIKWWLVGSSVGLRRRVVDYVRFYFIGMGVNVLGPSTIGGDVVRGLYLGEGRGRTPSGATAGCSRRSPCCRRSSIFHRSACSTSSHALRARRYPSPTA